MAAATPGPSTSSAASASSIVTVGRFPSRVRDSNDVSFVVISDVLPILIVTEMFYPRWLICYESFKCPDATFK
jgi:hypothetical protein